MCVIVENYFYEAAVGLETAMEKVHGHKNEGAGQVKPNRGRPVTNTNVMERITNRRHLLAALAEGVFSGDLHYIHRAIDNVKVIRDPIERELTLDLSLKLSRLIERILREQKEW